MIRVVIIRNPFNPRDSSEEYRSSFRRGMKVRDLCPVAMLDEVEHLRCTRNRVTATIDDQVVDGEVVTFTVMPKEEAAIIWFIVITIAEFIVSRALAPKPPKIRGDTSSPTYGFDGIHANRTEGEVVPKYYGRSRGAGQIVAEFIESHGAAGATYNVKISLGRGPIYRLMGLTADTDVDVPLRTGSAAHFVPRGWMFINGVDAADFHNVEVHVRLGSLQQKPINGFELSTQTFVQDLILRIAAAQNPNNGPEPMFFLGNGDPTLAADGVTSSNVLFATWGQSYAPTEVADEFTVVLSFTNGLFTAVASGGTAPWDSSTAVRYIELDGSGVPIATGGPEGDGYVRLRPTYAYESKSQNPFTIDLRFPFYDPQTYTRPGFGYGLANNLFATNTLPYAFTAVQPAVLANSTTHLGAFSIDAWILPSPDGSGGANNFSGVAQILTWRNVGSGHKGGFSLYMQNVSYTISPGHTRQRVVPVLSLVSTAGVAAVFFEGCTSVFADATLTMPIMAPPVANVIPPNLTHVVASYKPNADGALGRVRIWVNNVLAIETYTSLVASPPEMVSSPTPLGLCGDAIVHSPHDFFHGWMDEVVLWQGEMTQDDVRNSYNGGNGRTTQPTYLYQDGSATQIRIAPVAIWHFDEVGGSGAGLTIVDSSATGTFNLTTVSAPIAFGSSAGPKSVIELNVPTNTRKRGRYQIEVLRAYADAQNPVTIPLNGRFDACTLHAIQLHVDQKYSHPGSPIVGVRVPASQQLNGSAPNIVLLIDGRLVPVWDKGNTLNPTFTRQFNSDPAWIALDNTLDPTVGGVVFTAPDIDVIAFQEASDYFNEPVYDQRGDRLVYSAWTNLFYSSTLLGANGAGIRIDMPVANVPSHWQVGLFVGWYGLPAITAAGSFLDSNVDPHAGGGFEIFLITNDGAGTGQVYLKYPAGVLPPWNDSTSVSSQVTGSLTGTIEGRERRFMFDGANDQATGYWDWMRQTLATARATPVRRGSQITLKVERPRSPLDVLGVGQVIRETFSVDYLSPKTRINEIQIGFNDRDLNYERSQASLDHPSIQGTSALADIRKKDYFLEGVVRRTQVLRHIAFLLNVEYSVRRQGRMTASVDMVGREPGDVLRLAHDVMARGISGRLFAATDTTHVQLDRTVELLLGHSYKLLVRRAALPSDVAPEIVDVDAGATGGGVKVGYNGDVIVMATALAGVPQKDDVFLWYEDGQDLLIAPDSMTLTPDMKREVVWTEYLDTLYDVEGQDFVPTVDQVSFPLTATPPGSAQPPPAPSRVSAREVMVRGAGGTFAPGIAVTWVQGPLETVVASYEVHLSVDGGALELAATVGGMSSGATLALPEARTATRYTVAVVAVSARGTRLLPERGAQTSLKLLARARAPGPPTRLTTHMVGDRAVYDFIPDDLKSGASHVLRRAGWILGQPVGEALPGVASIGPSTNWTSAADGMPATLFMRARTGQSSWSDVLRQPWGPRAIGAASVVDLGATAFFSQSWESYGVGWQRSGMVTPNTTLVGCQVNAGGWMEFDGSSLTMTYTTSLPILESSQMTEDVYVSAFANASQIHPLTWDGAAFTWADCEHLTWEGPIDLIADGDDAGVCTLTIQVRYLDETITWSEWADFRPGRTQIMAGQFRIVCTRPSTAWNVRIDRFSTDILRAPQTKYDRDDLQYKLALRSNGNG